MTQKVKQFLEKVSADAELSRRLEHMSREDIVKLAGEMGINLSDSDFSASEGCDELSDSELSAVGGGDKCGCVVQGCGQPGRGDTSLQKCMCSITGTGEFEDGCERCTCSFAGGGVDK